MLTPTDRARDLLYAHLSSAQRRDLVQRGYFDCRGSVTGQTYRIKVPPSYGRYARGGFDYTQYLRNIHWVVLGWKIGSYCSQPDYGHCVPEYDRLLTQKLAIEANEAYFLENADFKLEDRFVGAMALIVCALASSTIVALI